MINAETSKLGGSCNLIFATPQAANTTSMTIDITSSSFIFIISSLYFMRLRQGSIIRMVPTAILHDRFFVLIAPELPDPRIATFDPVL